MTAPNTTTLEKRTGDGWAIATAAVAVFALLVGGLALLTNTAGGGDVEVAASSYDGPALEVEIELGDLYIEPAVVEVEAGRPLVVHVTNAGAMAHDLQVEGAVQTKMLNPGESQTVEVPGLSSTTLAWCTVPGHREAGMEMTFQVTGSATDVAASTGDATHDAHDEFASLGSNPAWEADFVPFDPTLAPAPGGTEHELTLRATETQMEVAPGVFQEVWTFEDQVPGPILRGKVGDLFTITIVNEGRIAHSMDFHSSRVAWTDEMRSIAPGESLVYQFRAEHAGIYMYHCGTAPALHHIGNGMFGAMIIDPPELATVDHEFVFVQSEWYLGPQGQPGDYTKMTNDDWDLVVFNGRWNQYAHSPIRVESGERVRVWVLDAGPSENSSFHIVGTIFDTVYKEGSYLLRPTDGMQGGSQALDLQPAQGGFVEFSFAEDGLYPIVTHKFSNTTRGAMGLFQSGEDFEVPAGAAH
jgi:nitrite reductase (NO-forming)